MSTQLAGIILADRYKQFNRTDITNANTLPAIETVGCEIPTESEDYIFYSIPPEISSLITGAEFWKKAKANRYRMLIREGHLDKLLHLAKMARSRANKAHPSHWFAKACSKANWETHTLPYFAKPAQVAAKAKAAAQRLGTKISKFVYKQIWDGINVERWAVMAQEVGRDKAKLFNWYCANERRQLAHAKN